jgi:hypothetical protein
VVKAEEAVNQIETQVFTISQFGRSSMMELRDAGRCGSSSHGKLHQAAMKLQTVQFNIQTARLQLLAHTTQ